MAEITLLAGRFPQQIRQFSAHCNGRIAAGVTVYETPTVAHAQYSAVTDEGQKAGALDFLFAWLLNERYVDKRYSDFGICNDKNGRLLNHGLLDWKEAFGGRTCVHDFYEIPTCNHPRLEPVLPPRPAAAAPAPEKSAIIPTAHEPAPQPKN